MTLRSAVRYYSGGVVSTDVFQRYGPYAILALHNSIYALEAPANTEEIGR